MGFQGHRFCLRWWLLLVVLICLSQGHLSSEKRLPFNSVADTFESIHKNIQQGLSERGVYSVFGKRFPRSSTNSASTTSTSTSTSSMEEWLWEISDTSTTTTEKPQEGVEFRQIIVFPTRCPKNHDFVAGKCRKRV